MASSHPSAAHRIDLSDPDAVKHWCEHFGVTEEQLREAELAVGPKVADVKEHLLNQGGSAGAG
jgi:hypothetical protein